jgi:GNAT superfamily N-acetyltransferase
MPSSPDIATEAGSEAAVSFRSAQHADLPTLLALIADDTLGKNREFDVANPNYLKAFEAISADPNQQLLVAELDGRILGMAQLSFIPGLSRGGAWRCNVEAVRIASDLRGQGLGAQLMQACEERARERGCTLLQLTSVLSWSGLRRKPYWLQEAGVQVDADEPRQTSSSHHRSRRSVPRRLWTTCASPWGSSPAEGRARWGEDRYRACRKTLPASLLRSAQPLTPDPSPVGRGEQSVKLRRP